MIWYDDPQWNDKVGFYRLSVLHQLASRVTSFAMASWGFFTSGFVTRHLWGVLAALTHLASKCTRHFELLAFYSLLRVEGVWKLVLSRTCSPLGSPLRVDGKWIGLLAFQHSPLRVDGEQTGVSAYFVLFFVFHLFLVSWVQFLHKWVKYNK